MFNSGIKYKGEVTIKVKGKPPVKSSNMGTKNLFIAICNILATKFSSIQDLYATVPCYMSIKKVVPNSNDINVNMSPMPIITREVQTDVNSQVCTVTLSALLSASNVLSLVESDGKMEYKVLLLSSDQETVYAESLIEYNLSEFTQDRYAQATISWNMTFSNATKDTDTAQEE